MGQPPNPFNQVWSPSVTLLYHAIPGGGKPVLNRSLETGLKHALFMIKFALLNGPQLTLPHTSPDLLILIIDVWHYVPVLTDDTWTWDIVFAEVSGDLQKEWFPDQEEPELATKDGKAVQERPYTAFNRFPV